MEGMVNRSRPTQAKRVREKALQEKRQQKAAKRQDAKERKDERGPMGEGEDPDLDACPGNGGGDQDGAWSRVPRSTERAQAHEGPALEVVHDGVAHPVPTEREEAA